MTQNEFYEQLNLLVDSHLRRYEEPQITIGYLIRLASELYGSLDNNRTSDMYAGDIQRYVDFLTWKEETNAL